MLVPEGSSKIHHENSKIGGFVNVSPFPRRLFLGETCGHQRVQFCQYFLAPVVFFSNFCFAKKHPWGASYFRSPRVSTTSPTAAGGRWNSWGNPNFQTHLRSLPLPGLFFRGRTVKLPGRVEQKGLRVENKLKNKAETIQHWYFKDGFLHLTVLFGEFLWVFECNTSLTSDHGTLTCFKISDGASKSRLMVRHRDDVIFGGTGSQFHETSIIPDPKASDSHGKS